MDANAVRQTSGSMYNLGVLGGMDFPDTSAMAESFQWYKQSAELGDALACDQVANYYYNGWGGAQQNLASYYHWLLEAAKLEAPLMRNISWELLIVGAIVFPKISNLYCSRIRKQPLKITQ